MDAIKFFIKSKDEVINKNSVRKLFGFCEYGCNNFLRIYKIKTEENGSIKPIDLMLQTIFNTSNTSSYKHEIRRMYGYFILEKNDLKELAKIFPKKRLKNLGASEYSIKLIESFGGVK